MRETAKNKILRAYQVYKSIRKVSRILNISYGSVHAVLKSQKALLPWSGFDRVNRWKGGRRGAVTRWIERHEGVVLPTSIAAIAELTGCTREDAHSWKTARWYKMKQVAKEVLPKELIRTARAGKLEFELIDGTTIGAEELFKLKKKKEGKK